MNKKVRQSFKDLINAHINYRIDGTISDLEEIVALLEELKNEWDEILDQAYAAQK